MGLFRSINILGFSRILAEIFLTVSRGGFVTLVFIMGILYFKNLSWKTTLVAIVLFAGAIIFGAAIGYWDRVETLATLKNQDNLSTDGPFRGRLALTRTGILLFKENVLIGVGPGQFGRKFLEFETKRFSSPIIHKRQVAPAAHNIYLEFAVENGIFGISVLSAIFIFSLRGLLQLSRNDPDNPHRELGVYLGISFVAILVSGFFLSGGQNKSLWLMVGLGFAAYNIGRPYNQSDTLIDRKQNGFKRKRFTSYFRLMTEP